MDPKSKASNLTTKLLARKALILDKDMETIYKSQIVEINNWIRQLEALRESLKIIMQKVEQTNSPKI